MFSTLTEFEPQAQLHGVKAFIQVEKQLWRAVQTELPDIIHNTCFID